MTDLLLSLAFRSTTCCVEGCRIVFAMERDYYDARRQDHASFYCPNGHSQHFTGESEAEKLTRQLDSAERMKASLSTRVDELREERDRERRRLRSMRGVVTRTKRRVGNGVCPCCKRSFSALREHMKRKHPDYAKCGSGDA